MKKNQKIKCDVTNCKYNNDKTSTCNLEEIQVSCNCNACDCETKRETICDDFQAKENE